MANPVDEISDIFTIGLLGGVVLLAVWGVEEIKKAGGLAAWLSSIMGSGKGSDRNIPDGLKSPPAATVPITTQAEVFFQQSDFGRFLQSIAAVFYHPVSEPLKLTHPNGIVSAQSPSAISGGALTQQYGVTGLNADGVTPINEASITNYLTPIPVE